MKPGLIGEVFSSIQGEGLYLGTHQFFIRFRGCALDCHYCDSREGYSQPTEDPLPDFFQFHRPLTIENLNHTLNQLKENCGQPHSLSLTGGEPLHHWQFLQAWLAQRSTPGLIFLETAGIFHKEYQEIKDHVDIISIDMKLPSSTGKEYWEEHRQFLKVSAGKDRYVKIVITPASSWEELQQAINIIEKSDPNLCLILQPVTPEKHVLEAPSEDQLFDLLKRSREYLADVRLIPQVHKLMHLP